MGKKGLIRLGSAQKDFRKFPREVRERISVELESIQFGDRPSSLKYLTDVGAGVVELKIKHVGRAFRVIFVPTHPGSIFAKVDIRTHVFEKKSRKTSRLDIETTRRRYRELKRMHS